MNVVAVVQARMASTRLPGKVLLKVIDRPMLSIQLERIRQARQIEKTVIATTDNSVDDQIEEFAYIENVAIYRGSENDVLHRFKRAAEQNGADIIVRLTADCPLIDPEIIDYIVSIFKQKSHGCNVVSNAVPRSYPAGLDVECFSRQALEIACAETTSLYDREHVTPYFYRDPNRFNLQSVICYKNLSAERWTLDEWNDYELIRKILEGLYVSNPFFRMKDIVDYLDLHPKLRDLNSCVQETPREIKDCVFGEKEK